MENQMKTRTVRINGLSFKVSYYRLTPKGLYHVETKESQGAYSSLSHGIQHEAKKAYERFEAFANELMALGRL